MFESFNEFAGAVTVCDLNYTIIYMNETSIKEFDNYGGSSLIGKNLLGCHNPNSASMIKDQMISGKSHSYIVEKKDGRKKVIHQSVWKEDGQIKGLIEISFYLD
jgi:transcriptional regulator with PAS, ATPase and Fis domain